MDHYDDRLAPNFLVMAARAPRYAMDPHSDRMPVAFDPSAICSRLDELRTALRWSWGDLEASCGVGERTIVRWRNGDELPLVGAVRRAVEVFGVSYEEITHGLAPRDSNDAPESGPPHSRRAA
jgi:hypothetical protein